MLKVSFRGDDAGRKVAFGLSPENIRKFREGLFYRVDMEELVPEWKGDVWIVSRDAMFKEVRELATAAQLHTGRPQVVLGLDKPAFEKLEGVPRRALSITLKEPWQGMVFFFRGETEADMLEEWAPLLGPDTRVLVDRV